jgi:hypothetical protein
MYCRFHKSLPLVSLLLERNPAYTLNLNLCNINFITTFPSTTNKFPRHIIQTRLKTTHLITKTYFFSGRLVTYSYKVWLKSFDIFKKFLVRNREMFGDMRISVHLAYNLLRTKVVQKGDKQ